MSELDEGVEDDEGTVYVERVWIDDKAAEKVARAVEGEPCTRYMVDGHWFEVRRDETPADRASETKRRKRKEEEGRRFAEAREAWELEERAREQWVASHLGDPGSVSVNLSFADFTNEPHPFAPTHMRRSRQRHAPLPASRSGARSLVR